MTFLRILWTNMLRFDALHDANKAYTFMYPQYPKFSDLLNK